MIATMGIRSKNMAMTDDQTAIEFRDVSFTLPDGRTLLSNLSLRVQSGETLVLLGRSGSGKTTTMKLINRLIDPTAGNCESRESLLLNGTRFGCAGV